MLLNRKIRSTRHAVDLFRNRKSLWQMLRAAFRGEYKMSLLTTLVLVAAVFYILDPIDFVPDLIPIVGWLDDGAIFYLLVKRLQSETLRYNRHKAMNRRGIQRYE